MLLGADVCCCNRSNGGVQERIRGDKFRQALSTVLKTWRSPHALADFYNMQLKEREVYMVCAVPRYPGDM